MHAEIITIGDEILIGQIIDTNSSWLGQELSRLGIQVVHRTSVADRAMDIMNALDEAKKRAELIIITGGLGPTKDDITKTTLASYFKSDMVLNEDVLTWIKTIFRSRKLPMVESNNFQAMVPHNCEVLFNRNGTAPGMWFKEDGVIYISLPGVPFEMKSLFEEECVPRIRGKYQLPSIVHHTIQTCCIGESFLSKKIEGWESALPSHIKLAYLPSVGQVRLRLSGRSDNGVKLNDEMTVLIKQLYDLIGEYIFGEEEDTLQKVTGELLKKKGTTLATAESCTGGYIAHLITSVPGSSSYYKGSIVSYDNRIKTSELGVTEEILNSKGAVSKECVISMAEGIMNKFNTGYAIATSGIAGPDGGTAEKPVGTVWIAVSSKDKTITHLFNMGDNRERTIQRTAVHALDMLRRMLISDQ